MDDRVLKAAGRGHTAADTVRASRLIRESGMALGLQMMTGLPMDTEEGAFKTATALAALSPDTVRIYPTVVLRHTALASMMRQGQYTPPTLEQSVALAARLLQFFELEQGIPVIRLGLHDGETLREDVLAGGYHPALRELCEGRLYLDAAMQTLVSLESGSYTLRVAPAAVSKMVGQRRCNVETLRQNGYIVQVQGDSEVPLWQVRVIRKE